MPAPQPAMAPPASPVLAEVAKRRGEEVSADKAATLASQSMLAYEHHVSVTLAEARIAQQLAAVQQACLQRRFGDCLVLDVNQRGGSYPHASLTLRVVPQGVEPLIALAGEGGALGERSTHAEDLAQSVQDNQQVQQRLNNERTQLLGFQQRRDLKVADMIELSSRLADVEAQLQTAQQEGAQHAMRIATQKLSIDFTPLSVESGRNEIALALRDFGQTLSTGTAWTIRAAAFLIPIVVGLLILLAIARLIVKSLWRALWRRWRN